jgi:hypothetical protein
MGKQVFWSAALAIASLAWTACSNAPKAPAEVAAGKKEEPAKAPEPITAERAFYETYKPARSWATDLLVLSIVSGEIPGMKNEGGKAGLWTVTFVSPSRREARKFTYAVASSGEEYTKGVNISNALPWSGATPASKPFAKSEFAADSDAAYKVAAEKAGPWLKKHPNMQEPTFRLGNASRLPAPVWYIMWGTNKNGYAAVVNATTGTLITK